MSRPCCWPITRWPSVSPRRRMFSSSFLTMRPTGMPVQSDTTLATACASTEGMISGRVALQRGQLLLLDVQLGQHGLAVQVLVFLAAQLGAQFEDLVDDAFLFLPAGFQADQALAFDGQLLGHFLAALADVDADRQFAADDAFLDLQRLDPARAVFHLGRCRMLADGHAGAGGVEQADGLVGQLAARGCSGGSGAPPPRSLHRAVARGGASPAPWPRRAASARPWPRPARAPARPGSGGVSAGSFSMYFLYSAQVVAPIVRRLPRASAGFSRLAASPVPAARRRRPACGLRR